MTIAISDPVNAQTFSEAISDKLKELFDYQKEVLKSSLDPTESFGSDLRTAVDRLEDPVPTAKTISFDQLEELEQKIDEKMELVETRCARLKENILRISQENPHIEQLRRAGRPDEEILEAMYRLYRDMDPTLSLSQDLYEMAIRSRIQEQQLKEAKKNLILLKSLREKITQTLKKSEFSDDVLAMQQEYDLVCEQLRDFCDRGFVMGDIDSKKLPEPLRPYLSSILYLQAKMGIVLRKEQLEALAYLVTHKKCLKQLRMGLGKTSVLLPFALQILRLEGKIPIGIVPEALFKTNFDELDPTTRTVFELAGDQFLLSRKDGTVPVTEESLLRFTSVCESFLSSLARGEYVLTTIDTKASLDDKLVEYEHAFTAIVEELSRLKAAWIAEDVLEEEKIAIGERIKKAEGEKELLLHAMEAGEKVKDIFEAGKTRILVDEADSVLKASYSVNFELGRTEGIPKEIVGVVDTVITIVKEFDEIKQVFIQNEQFALSEQKKKEFLIKIADKWCSGNGVDKKWMLWLVGEGEAPEKVTPELALARQAIGVSLRACMGLKIGVSADFDALHHAFGVPAFSGTVAEGTKFSDPVTQYMLTQMIFMNKAPDEAFLRGRAKEVLLQLEKLTDDTARKAQTLLESLLKNKDPKISFAKELSGSEPEKMLLRFLYAKQVVENMLIQVSGQQISRPVQDALRGCNVLCLTGTATQNLRYLVGEDGMKQVKEEGRATVAEVLQRIQSGNPKIIGYEPSSEKQLEWLQKRVKETPPYRFFINQGGIADQLKQKEIVETLFESAGGVPIVYVCNDPDNAECFGKKTVHFASGDKPIDDCGEEERKLITDKAIFYYHTPYVRGTDFKIPIGAKGMVILSPTVNASDRDQAVYRARKLGAGHGIDIAIPVAQKALVEKEKNPLQALFKIHHHQTMLDEQKEDMRALFLHIKGVHLKAVERMKKHIVLEEGFSDAKMVSLFKATEDLFLQDTSTQAYLDSLVKSFKDVKVIETKGIVEQAVEYRIKRLNVLREKLETDGFTKNVLQFIGEAIKELEAFKQEMLDKWKDESKRFPKELPTSGQETSDETSTSQSQEQEEQQQMAQSLSESSKATVGGTKSLFGEVNRIMLDSIGEDSFDEFCLKSQFAKSVFELGKEQALPTGSDFFYTDISLHKKHELQPSLPLSRVYCLVLDRGPSGPMYMYINESQAYRFLTTDKQVWKIPPCKAAGIYKANVDQNGKISWKSFGVLSSLETTKESGSPIVPESAQEETEVGEKQPIQPIEEESESISAFLSTGLYKAGWYTPDAKEKGMMEEHIARLKKLHVFYKEKRDKKAAEESLPK